MKNVISVLMLYHQTWREGVTSLSSPLLVIQSDFGFCRCVLCQLIGPGLMCIVYIEWPNLIHLGVTQNYFLVILVSGVDTLGVCALRSTPAVLFFENNS